MIQTLNFTTFANTFQNSSRKDQFSYEALELIFDYIEDYERDTGEKVEFDMIAICCEWSESPPSEIMDYHATDIDTDNMSEEEIAAAVFEWLNDETIVAGVTSAGNLVYVQF
jgi:hypothetical protein